MPTGRAQDYPAHGTPASMSGDQSLDLRELVGAVRAHLEFEQQMGTPGLLPIAVARDAGAVPPELAKAAAVEPSAGGRSVSPGPGVSAVVDAPQATTVEPGLPAEDRQRRLAVLAQEAASCNACVLHEKRTQAVFARGNPMADLVFVGEGPGRDEDQQGLPFVGAAGKLLDRMIAAMGFAQNEIYICNVVKCRPPENRTPKPEEAIACARFLHPQLQLVAPKVIVALGRCAAEHLGVAGASGPWRGRWGRFQGVPVMPTYHPAFLLRSPQFKRAVWDDLQVVMKRFERN